MSNPTAPTSTAKPGNARVTPGLETTFHIDYDWWNRDGHDLNIALLRQLPPDKRALLELGGMGEKIDFIDPVTAEVRRVDGLQQAIMNAASDANWINDHTMLVDAMFRIFLANGNKPLTPVELGKLLKKPPTTLLGLLAGRNGQVYNGIRPVLG